MSKSKMRIGSILLVVAMLMTLLPVGVFAAEGDVFMVDGKGYTVWTEAVEAAKAASNADITLVGTFAPETADLATLLTVQSDVIIEKGASLILPSDSEGTEAWFGGADARMNIKEGFITLSGLNNLSTGGVCTWTLSDSAQVEIPEGKTAYLHFSLTAENKTGVKLVIPETATLEVNGTLRAISGTSGLQPSTVEVSGQMNVNGAVSAAAKTTTTVGTDGNVAIAKTGKVETTGTLTINAADNGITLAEGAVLSVPDGTTVTAVKDTEGNSITKYTDANGNTVCVVSDVAEPEAAIGGVLYETLEDALKAAVSGDTITVVKNADISAEVTELPEGVAIAIPAGKTLTVANELTISKKSGFVVGGTLKADAEGDNIKGNTDSAYIQLLAGGKFVKNDDSNVISTPETAKYVWSYLDPNNLDATVADGSWKTETEDLVITAEYWKARVEAKKDTSDTSLYKPTWEELRNLTFFYQIVSGLSSDPTYGARVTAVNTFITTTVTKLDMSNQTIIAGGDSGILAGYTGLIELNLSNTGISEVGGLAGLTSLKVLNLSNNSALADTADSKVLGSLAGLTSLETLDVSNTGVSDLGGILGATGLTTLNISSTKVTNMDFMWNDSDPSDVNHAARFASLTNLIAKNLSLDNINGLVQIVSKDGFTNANNAVWDLSGSTILYTHKDHVDAVTAKLAEKFKAPTVIYPDDGGSTTTPTSYGITVSTAENGTVKSSNSSAAKDATVTITVTPNEGYVLDTLTVTDKDNNTVALTKVSDTQYTFKMPASAVTVKATFKKDEGTQPAALPFNDVSESEWFYEAVKYVYDKGMMNGVSDTSFAPYSNLTRGMIAQVLYNLEGKPAVSGSAYTDVAADQWYNDAVNWAAQKGIVTGYGNGTFGPMDNITREQMAAILYRYAQYKGYDVSAKGDLTAFTDGNTVSDWAKDAMSWAVGTALFNGKGDGILDPTTTATRAEVAKILMTYCENVAK